MPSVRVWRILIAVVVTGVVAVERAPAAGDDFFFKPKDRIVFLGDSITEQYDYTNLIEYYLVTRFPQWDLTTFNAGIGGDTAGGGLSRVERDVLGDRPTAVTINFGMNDGGYRGPDQNIYANYIKNQTGLVKKLVDAKARVALLSTSPVEGRKKNNESYNETLGKFSDGLKELASKNPGVLFVDQFHRELPVLHKMAEDKAPFDCFPDSVHTNSRGGLLMAWGILTAMHAPAVVSDATLDERGNVIASKRCKISDASLADGKLTFHRQDEALPLVLTTEQKQMLSYLNDLNDLNRYGLTITGLDKDAKYDLAIDGISIGSYTGDQLGRGVNLAVGSLGPITDQSTEVWQALLDKNNLMRYRGNNYRLGRGIPPGLSEEDRKQFTAGRDQELTIIDRNLEAKRSRVYKLAQPKNYRFDLTRVK